MNSILLNSLYVTRSIVKPISILHEGTEIIGAGNLDYKVGIETQNEIGDLSRAFDRMTAQIRENLEQISTSREELAVEIALRQKASEEDWLKTGMTRLNDVMRGRVDVVDLSSEVLGELATYLNAKVGALFLLDNAQSSPLLKLMSGYAYSENHNPFSQFKVGEGLVGQAAREKKQILLENIPQDHIKVVCGFGESCPRCVTVSPFLFDGQVKGVIELGFTEQVSSLKAEYLEQAMPAIAINVETAMGREELAKALARSQALAEELQVQQERLRAANEELEEHTRQLRQSEEELKAKQEELEEANRLLEENNRSLECQKHEIEQARHGIEEKAEQLAAAGRYKSEFLANMSHELRTPLNSILLLARLLADNKDGILSAEHARSAQIIYSSGNDLLSLIDEILDLSRIEAGRMELQIEEILIEDVAESVRANFKHMAEDKGLQLRVSVAADCPDKMWTDRKRLEQILRNLISNALKFTERGGIDIHFSARPGDAALFSGRPDDGSSSISIAVTDTGIGIAPEKQNIVFEAFQQAEGGTTRKYGGTGLGLSISRELAKLLGGEIQLVSEAGRGSTFSLHFPLRARQAEKHLDTPSGKREMPGILTEASHTGIKAPVTASVPDDREKLEDGDRTILIIDDDQNFAGALLGLCHERGFKCLVSASGEDGLELARTYLPKAVILDIKLPGMDGWAVLNALKEDPKIRHIPVHIISVTEKNVGTLGRGAIGYLRKPVTKEDLEEALGKLEYVFSRGVKEVLIVEDDENLRKSIVQLIGNGDVHADEAANGTEALRALEAKSYDCMILDLGLPDMAGLDLLKTLTPNEAGLIPSVIVYTGKDLTREEEEELRNYSDSVIIKAARSEERLLDEAALFLHRMVEVLPEKKRRIITDLHDTDATLKDRKILIVDDDMRNAFALSRVLGEKGIKTLKAANGQKALELLDEHPDVDLVLMDIMMPVMDGYEAMRRIRAQERFKKLPIIALTAKAMSKDREQCLASGANDYLSKPVDEGRLLSLMRVWMYR